MSVDIASSMLTEKALDYAQLSSLAYSVWTKVGSEWVPEATYQSLWDKMHEKGYRVVAYCPNDPNTGYSGTIFYNSNTGQYILANRGTEIDGSKWPPEVEADYNDLKADVEIFQGFTPAEQFTSMMEFIAQNNLNMYQFNVTGHSLGGCLAQMAKATYNINVDEVYTYNAPGAKELVQNYYYKRDSTTPGMVVVTYQEGITWVETEWKQETWDLYQTFLNNKQSIDDSKVYNITAKGGVSPIAHWGTDIGLDVFVNGASHLIDSMISNLETGVYYIDSRRLMEIIGSKADEILDARYNSGKYSSTPQKITIVGGNGNDTIYAGDGGNLIYGDLPDGFTDLNNESGNAGGVAGNDSIIGGDGKDTIYGGDGNNTIYGLKGEDYIVGGKDNDTIYGGSENDSIWGGEGYNEIYGDDDNDYIVGGSSYDLIYGGDENDNIFGGNGSNYLDGGEGADRLEGGKDRDIIYGGDGNDHIIGGNGVNTLFGDAGNDFIVGGKDNDVIFGGAGNDVIYAGGGSNSLSDESGHDTYKLVSSGKDTIGDSDGKGSVYLDNVQLIGGKKIRECVYTGGGNTYIWSGIEGTPLIINRSKTISNFHNEKKDLGIYLYEDKDDGGGSSDGGWDGGVGAAGGVTIPCDPLLIDLNGDGIQTTSLTSGTFFDYDGNGFAERMGWASSDDGILVLDRNNDGIINDGSELFGDQTLLSTGKRAANGFQALADLDSNADGKIDVGIMGSGLEMGIMGSGLEISVY